MKAIILAAGQGTRLKKYTQDLPKGMLMFDGKTIIERQLEIYRQCGIDDISIVRGYAADKITYAGVKYYENHEYASTNMVESLMAASKEFDDDVIVSYSDILFEPRLLRTMAEEAHDFCVSVDSQWRDYWKMRYGRVDFDTESLSINEEGIITELGLENPPLDSISARYIGLLKFSRSGLAVITDIMNKAYRDFEGRAWQQSGKPVRKAYMTDLLNAIIESGRNVNAVYFAHGWIEFDTNEDYENACEWQKTGELAKLIKI